MFRCMLFALALGAADLMSQDAPPVVTYGGTRESTNHVEFKGVSYAVDKGAEWQGVRVYLSLFWDLLGVDAKTGKAIWKADVGAFWNEFTFKEVEPNPGAAKVWAVELRPGRGTGRGDERRQYHDLKTGEEILRKSDDPAGKKIEPLVTFEGDATAKADALFTVIDNQKDWEAFVVTPYFGDSKKRPDFGTVDFREVVALVNFSGDAVNCRGIGMAAWEDESRILVRLHHRTFQTEGPDGGAVKLRPWGIAFLPRRAPFKPIVVERNKQRMIGGPALWTEVRRFDAAPQPPDRKNPK